MIIMLNNCKEVTIDKQNCKVEINFANEAALEKFSKQLQDYSDEIKIITKSAI
jgi:hypothetical protein